MASFSNGIDSWVLMALIQKDIDDFDFKNGLVLSERLFAIDNNSEEFRFLYAKCHYLLKDYNAAYDLLKSTITIPCRHLFARNCLELGNRADATDKNILYWRTGIQSLQQALSDYSKLQTGHHWADDLACVASRSHMPSQSSIRNLLGELYNKLDNMHGSAQQLLQCLDENPFKLTAYISMCNIAPDSGQPDSIISPTNIFKEFNLETTLLERSKEFNFPLMPISTNSKAAASSKHNETKHTTIAAPQSIPATIQQNSTTSDTIPSKKPRLDYLMPAIRSSYIDIPLNQLRALVDSSIQAQPEMRSWNDEPERAGIEKSKDEILAFMADDIEKQKAEEAFKNKHGLHKKPPMEATHDITVDPKEDSDEVVDTNGDFMDFKFTSPPRLYSSSTSNTSNPDAPVLLAAIKNRLRSKRTGEQLNDTTECQRIVSPFKTTEYLSQQPTTIDSYFIPWFSNSPTSPPVNQEPLPSTNKRPSLGKTTTGITTTELTSKAAKEAIIDAMNRIIRIILIIAKGHFYQSRYYGRETALELQKLDNSQYDTPSVLCLMGRAYYDAGDHAGARIFYRRSFSIAPWYCKGVPLYSTCLWYLEKERELCLLAKVMKDNHSHQYEAYIAAGNWTKCSNRGNEAARWFQKAVDLDPSRSYGHALLGYEEWEKGNCLGAKQHFAQCMNTNKRSYFGWYGSATAYQGMDEFQQARRLIEEAIRLHPRHPVLLGTMAEILLSLKEYNLANRYVEKSLAIRDNTSLQELKKKIKRRLEFGDTDTSL